MVYVINIDKNYPETLNKVIILEAGWIFKTVWSVIKSWIDPGVAAKISFLSFRELEERISFENIPKRILRNFGNRVDPKLLENSYEFQYFGESVESRQKFIDLRANEDTRKEKISTWGSESLAYYQKTLTWAYDEESLFIDSEREALYEKMKLAYIQVVPYIRYLTHYHRAGFITDEMDPGMKGMK